MPIPDVLFKCQFSEIHLQGMAIFIFLHHLPLSSSGLQLKAVIWKAKTIITMKLLEYILHML